MAVANRDAIGVLRRRGSTRILVDRATGTAAADASATAALEMASGLWGRAFAAGAVSPVTARTAAVTPAVLQLAARQAIRYGESLFLIDVTAAGLIQLLPCVTWHVLGGVDPAEWQYVASVAGPSVTATRTVPASGVVWLPFSTQPDRPWIGRGPMASASSTGARSPATSSCVSPRRPADLSAP